MESSIEKECVTLAERDGWFVRKTAWVGRRGCPDRFFAKDFVSVWVEFKRPGELPDPAQAREIVRMSQAGLTVHVCHSVDQFCSLMGIERVRAPDLFTR